MKKTGFLFVFFSISVLLAACATSAPKQDASLHGEWKLQSFTLEAGGDALTPVDTKFGLTLDEDGRVHGQVACNRLRGGFEVTDEALRFERLSRTRARCLIEDAATEALERRFLGQLRAEVRYELAASELVLRFDDGTHWRLRRDT